MIDVLSRQTKAAPVAWTRAAWFVVMTGLVTLFLLQLTRIETAPWLYDHVGFDYQTYTDAARDWLAGDGFYEAYQLAGPYPVVAREVLYPPPILVLLVPFTVLPAVLWWAIPLGVTVWVVWSWRPSPWAWAAILACLTLPMPIGISTAEDVIKNGNPAMWIMAAIALGTRWPAVAPWALLKPPIGLLSLALARHRSWWIGLAVFAVVCLAFAPMWTDYVTVMQQAQWIDRGPLYTLVQAPLIALPLIASAGRDRRTRSTAEPLRP